VSRRVQVIGAHSADFVWRAGGAVAKAVEAGGTAEVIALSYGERGESGELWKEPDQTVDNVKRVRHQEAEAAARHYYGAGAGALGSEQSARLAAIVPNPRFYDRNRNTPFIQRKTATILARMPAAELP